MSRLRTRTLLSLALVLASAPAWGAGVHWRAAEPLGQGQVGSLELVFEGTEPAGTVEAPEVDGLRVVGAPSQSTERRVVNGRRSERFALAWPVRPERQGTLEIPAFEVETTSGRIAVAAASLEVGRPLLAASGRGGALARGDVISAELRPEQERPYAGEVFDLHALVASAMPAEPLGAPEWRDTPLVAEAWRDAGRARTAQGEIRRLTTRAFAPESGRLELPPLRQEVEVETGRAAHDLFSLFAAPETARVMVASEPVAIEVQPLPAGAPPGFAGAVGRFALDSKLVPERPRAGEPVTWTLTLRGTGNWPAGIALPAREIPAGLRAIAPEAQREFEPDDLFSGAISEDLVLIPDRAGLIELPPVEFAYFDPRSGRYETARALPPRLEVAPGAAASAGGAAAASPRAAATAGRAPAPHGPAAGAAIVEATGGPALPRDPLAGSETALAPFARAPLLAAAAAPVAALLVYWLALAVGHARSRDPGRPRRDALRAAREATLAAALARDAAERCRALLAWERAVSTLFGVEHRAPTAERLRGAAPGAPGRAGRDAWLALFEEAEHALYASSGELAPDWCERARHALAGVRRPWPNPLRALLPRHLLPATAAAALWLAFAGPAAAEPVSDYASGRVAAAEGGFEARAAQAPTDWIARYNLGLAASQLGEHGRALGETLAAWLLAPRSEDAAWNLEVFASRLRGADPRIAALATSRWLGLLARQAPPAAWQIALVAASALFSAGVALRLGRRFGRGAPRLARAGLPLAAAAALVAVVSLASLRAWGVFIDPRASLLARDAVLHSIPTDAEANQARRPLPAGVVVRADREFLGWTRVELATGETGWLRREVLVPFYAKPVRDGAPVVAGTRDGRETGGNPS